MPISTNNGFSEEEIDQCKGWLLPDISNGEVISATVNKQKEKSISNKNTDNEEDEPETIEVIEDVDISSVEENAQAISAEQLEKITEDAEKEGYQTGFDKGLEEGKKQGLTSGLDESKKIIADQSQRLKNIIDVLLNPVENEKKKIEQILVDMTCRLTKTLLERELKTESSTITDLIDSVLILLPQTMPSFTLFLNPDDIALTEKHLNEKFISDNSDNTVQYKLKEDKTLLPGGCRLESDHTSVDASMETKLEKLLSDFIEKRHTKKIDDPVEKKDASTEVTTNDVQTENTDVDENND